MRKTATPARRLSRISAAHLGAEWDRFRCGSGPIWVRSATDFEAEVDRSGCGVRPISMRKWTDLGAGYDRSRGVRGATGVMPA